MQVNSCINEFAPRPDMTVPFLGTLTQVPRALCMGKEVMRESSKLVHTFASGTPKLKCAKTDVHGFGTGNRGITYNLVETQQGSVKLPVESETFQYLPSVSTLNFLTQSQDSRLQQTPSRYFSR